MTFLISIWLVPCIIFYQEAFSANKVIALIGAMKQTENINLSVDVTQYPLENRLIRISGPLTVHNPISREDGIEINIPAVKFTDKSEIYESSMFTSRWTPSEELKTFNKSHVYVAKNVSIGQFVLSEQLIEKFETFVETYNNSHPLDPTWTSDQGYHYKNNDTLKPQNGDIRTKFFSAGIHGQVYTVIGSYKSGTIYPYKTPRGVEILILLKGEDKAVNGYEQVIKNELFSGDLFLYRLFLLFLLYDLSKTICVSHDLSNPIYDWLRPRIPQCTIFVTLIEYLIMVSMAWIYQLFTVWRFFVAAAAYIFTHSPIYREMWAFDSSVIMFLIVFLYGWIELMEYYA